MIIRIIIIVMVIIIIIVHKITTTNAPTPSTVRYASVSNIAGGKTYTYPCEGGSVEGRFVDVIIPGTRKAPTLCEMKVYAA